MTNKSRLIASVIALSLLTSCISQKEVYDSYSKGGHPAGRSKLKKKHTKIGFTN